MGAPFRGPATLQRGLSTPSPPPEPRPAHAPRSPRPRPEPRFFPQTQRFGPFWSLRGQLGQNRTKRESTRVRTRAPRLWPQSRTAQAHAVRLAIAPHRAGARRRAGILGPAPRRRTPPGRHPRPRILGPASSAPHCVEIGRGPRVPSHPAEPSLENLGVRLPVVPLQCSRAHPEMNPLCASAWTCCAVWRAVAAFFKHTI